MTLTLNPTIGVPNINRVRLRRPEIDDDNAELIVRADVLGVGGAVYKQLTIKAANTGASIGVAATVAPAGYDDRVGTIQLTIANAYTNALAAYTGGGATQAAKLRALETWFKDNGLLPAGDVG